jgi:murein DD-endopeptidase MepM/ murein hydrolase activator NlpD
MSRAVSGSVAIVAAIVAIAVLGVSPAGARVVPQADGAMASGGSRYWAASRTGGIEPGTAAPTSGGTSRERGKRRPPPVIAAFSLVSHALFDEGRPLKLRYRVKARSRSVRVRLLVRTAGGTYVHTIDLGQQRTGVALTGELTRDQLGIHATGNYKLRLLAIDRNGRRAARAARVPAWLEFSFSDHRFPLAGPFSWGGEDSRFGAGRPGHIHQGQDLSAAEGTPVVAPYGGTISWVQYQADGAGWYVVLHSLDGRDYVFMHLRAGSIAVKAGDAVPTGSLLGKVGTTGSSSGPHLHFEVWTGGPWQFGGKPVDPRPLLESWYASAPGGATTARLATASTLD